MIIVKLSGGLGNQLFQYLFGLSQSRRYALQVFFDLSEFLDSNAIRKFVLLEMQLPGNFISCSKIKISHNKYLIRAIKFHSSPSEPYDNLEGKEYEAILEPEVTYDSSILLKKSGYYQGYWQSPNYWYESKSLLSYLNQKLSDLEKLRNLHEKAKKFPYQYDYNALAIHIRRGDYLESKNILYHGHCATEYYQRAAHSIVNRTKIKILYTFSDDQSYDFYMTSLDYLIINVSKVYNDPIDEFLILRQFNNIIISNSSYGYLAAVLSCDRNPTSRVAYPYPWYAFIDAGPEGLSNWLPFNAKTGNSSFEDDAVIKDARISVVIPVHTRAVYIAECVASVVQQTHKPYEIIISKNAASTEVSKCVDEMKIRYPFIRVIECDEAGLSLARNRGIQASNSDWISFIDDDDLWAPETLQTQIRNAIRMNADFVVVDYFQFNENHARLDVSRLHELSKGRHYPSIVLENKLAGGSSTLIKKSVFSEIGFFDEMLPACEDHDMWRRIILANFRLVIILKKLVGYRRNTGNMTSNRMLMLRGKLGYLARLMADKNIPFETVKLYYSSMTDDLKILRSQASPTSQLVHFRGRLKRYANKAYRLLSSYFNIRSQK